jgi:porin
LRNDLAERGVTLGVYGTEFYQGVIAGGREREGEFGTKLDYLLNLDGGKLGLWQGLFVDLHGETRLGNSVNNIDGLLLPANIAMAFPRPDEDITALTGFKVTQALSENFAVFAGKINTLDEYPVRFSPQLGLERPGLGGFMNTSLVFNPILARTVPYATFGIGGAVLEEGEPVMALTVLDPEDRSTEMAVSNLYDRGAVFVLDFIMRSNLLDRPGLYNFGATYSTAQYRSTDPEAYAFIPDIGVVGEEVEGSWCVYLNFYQAIWVDPCDEKRNWGFFGEFGVSDGNPNPIRYVANWGFAGRSMLPGRKLDTFGLGFFYTGLSEQFKALAAPLLAQQDEYGMEVFYNLAVTPWCRLTADLQIAEPSTKGLDTAYIPGLRLMLDF